MIRGAESALIPQILDVVVVAGVLQGHRLGGIDIPHLPAGGELRGGGIGQHVIERAHQPGELVGVGIRLEMPVQIGVTGLLKDPDRVLLRIGVEIPHHKHRLIGKLRRDPIAQRLRLLGAQEVVIALVHILVIRDLLG